MLATRIYLKTFLVLFTCLLPQNVWAADPNISSEASSLVPYVDYSGDLRTRPALTGDWGGRRQELMDKGLRFDASLTQTFQHNWAGGTKYESTWQDGLDFGLQLDTGKMDLWPGGLLTIRGESRFGRSNNANTGALMPVNSDSLLPVPEEDLTTLSELHYMQFLSPQVAVMGGKMSPRFKNIFAHDETSQFMNTAFFCNPVIGTTVPLDFLGGGVLVVPTHWLSITTLALDSEGNANHSGFPEVFERGTSLFQETEATVKPWGLTGHQRVAWTWSDKSRIQFTQNPRTVIGAIITGDTSQLRRSSNDWSFYYDFDQYVYTRPGTEDQGVGFFGRFGLADDQVNIPESFYSLGLGGKGMLPGRTNDTFGVGYCFLNLTDNLPRVIQRRIDNEQGVEIYYNVAVTPWLHITPDLQVIDPVRKGVDTTVVAGLRAKIDF